MKLGYKVVSLINCKEGSVCETQERVMSHLVTSDLK